jgi:hypothetical protein
MWNHLFHGGILGTPSGVEHTIVDEGTNSIININLDVIIWLN